MGILAAAALSSCSQKDEISAEMKGYYNLVVKELSSGTYMGRSDYANGDIRAAKFIIGELQKAGAEPVISGQTEFRSAYPVRKSVVRPFGYGRWQTADSLYFPYLQNFTYPLNVMRGAMSLSVDGVKMEPTVDYTVKEFSPSCSGEFKVEVLEEEYYTPEKFFKYLNSGAFKKSFILLDWQRFKEKMPVDDMEIYNTYFSPLDMVGGLILQDKEQFPFFKARSYYRTPMPVLMVNSTFPKEAGSLKIEIESEMIPQHDAHNIIARIEGTKGNDERILFMAHYDHLELMGKDNVFAGANDNASGVAMLLSLAKYFSIHKPETTVDFLFLDGEEENLLGAFYYAENAPAPLEKIKYAVNVDMVGDTGDTLICEISKEGENGLQLFREINKGTRGGFNDIKCQELTDNSDHYAFALKGVPVIYFTVEGEYYKYYHTPRDIYDNTSDMNFERIFNLITSFVSRID